MEKTTEAMWILVDVKKTSKKNDVVSIPIHLNVTPNFCYPLRIKIQKQADLSLLA